MRDSFTTDAGTENTANKGTNVDINFLSLRNTTGYKMMYYNILKAIFKLLQNLSIKSNGLIDSELSTLSLSLLNCKTF